MFLFELTMFYSRIALLDDQYAFRFSRGNIVILLQIYRASYG